MERQILCHYITPVAGIEPAALRTRHFTLSFFLPYTKRNIEMTKFTVLLVEEIPKF
jgi:hypothetical protein